MFTVIPGYRCVLFVVTLFFFFKSLILLPQSLCPFHQWLENHTDGQTLTTNLFKRLQIKTLQDILLCMPVAWERKRLAYGTALAATLY